MAYDPANDEDEEEEVKDDGLSVEQKLIKTIYDGDFDEFRMVLLDDPDVFKLAAYGKKGNEKITPLFIAVSKKNLKMVKALIDYAKGTGDDPDKKQEKAAEFVNIKAFPSGNTALHIAAMWAQHKIVNVLLKNGANPVENNNKKKNPIQIIGIKYKQSQITDKINDDKTETQVLLLMKGADKAQKYKEDRFGAMDDAYSALGGIKGDLNARLKAIGKVNPDRLAQVSSLNPICRVKTNRYKAWKKQSGLSIKMMAKGNDKDIDDKDRKIIGTNVKIWHDKDNDMTYVNFGKLGMGQLAWVKAILAQGKTLESGKKIPGIVLEECKKPPNAKWVKEPQPKKKK